MTEPVIILKGCHPDEIEKEYATCVIQLKYFDSGGDFASLFYFTVGIWVLSQLH